MNRGVEGFFGNHSERKAVGSIVRKVQVLTTHWRHAKPKKGQLGKSK